MKKLILALSVAVALTGCSSGGESEQSAVPANDVVMSITEQNYAEAETARMYGNWQKLGANKDIAHMRNLPPRGNKAPVVQMNDDTLYSVVITKADKNGNVTFTIPESDIYLAVQVVTEGGHGQHYIEKDGTHTVNVETEHAFLIYRSGMEKGIERAREVQDTIPADSFIFNTYQSGNYDSEELHAWTTRLTAETQGEVFVYTFPRESRLITDLHQWNLENANGWGGASPELNVGNLYTNSIMQDGSECRTTTFDDPESVFFTSITAYDKSRYLLDDVKNVNSYTWDKNEDGTITTSFNCGADASNNIDTKGQDYSFTMRYYGVSQKVLDGKVKPESTIKAASVK